MSVPSQYTHEIYELASDSGHDNIFFDEEANASSVLDLRPNSPRRPEDDESFYSIVFNIRSIIPPNLPSSSPLSQSALITSVGGVNISHKYGSVAASYVGLAIDFGRNILDQAGRYREDRNEAITEGGEVKHVPQVSDFTPISIKRTLASIRSLAQNVATQYKLSGLRNEPEIEQAMRGLLESTDDDEELWQQPTAEFVEQFLILCFEQPEIVCPFIM
jgi:hypothetical protein